MAGLDDILSQLPLDQLASALGTDTATVRKAAEQAVPTIVHGMNANAQDAGGAAKLQSALADHAARALDTGNIDLGDGAKILQHIFGNQTDGVAKALSSGGGTSNDLIAKLLPMLAPIVMNMLGKQSAASGKSGSTTDLGGLLGGLLGGSSKGGGLDLGGILGGLLGGGSK